MDFASEFLTGFYHRADPEGAPNIPPTLLSYLAGDLKEALDARPNPGTGARRSYPVFHMRVFAEALQKICAHPSHSSETTAMTISDDKSLQCLVGLLSRWDFDRPNQIERAAELLTWAIGPEFFSGTAQHPGFAMVEFLADLMAKELVTLVADEEPLIKELIEVNFCEKANKFKECLERRAALGWDRAVIVDQAVQRTLHSRLAGALEGTQYSGLF